MTERISKDIVDLQDIEKIQFMQALQADPAAYRAYVSGHTDRILAETIDTKRASFVKVAGDMGRMMDMDHNSLIALNRSYDLANTHDQIIAQQQQQYSTKRYNTDMSRRQVEINNWYYENKRETLFVLQLILLVVLSIVVILGTAAYGWLTEDGANYLMSFVIVVGAGVWVYRWYYTTTIRDPRYWNKRRFEADAAAPPDVCYGPNGKLSGV